MEVELGTAVAVATAIFTAGGAWFTVRSTTQRLEAQREKDTALAGAAMEKLEGRVTERLREYGEKKDDQARRIGRVEQRMSVVEGRLQSEDGGGRRRLTAGMGVPIPSDSDE